MPWYEYRCDANGRTLEAMHPMATTVTTWGELCALADEPVGETDPATPVEKLFSASLTVAKGSGTPEAARGGGMDGPCGAGCGCHPG